MIKLGIVMDSISSINIEKDSSFAMLLEAQRRNYKVYYMEIDSLYLRNNKAQASAHILTVQDDRNTWYILNDKQNIYLSDLDVILMRKNPPIDAEFIYATYILEHAERLGTLIVNKPQSIRDYNEKLFSTWFPQYVPDTLVSCRKDHILAFYQKHGDIILKPLNSMGGASVFRVKQGDCNIMVIVETLTNCGRCFCIAQNYIPSIKDGDKRVLLIDGEPVPYCLARIPKQGEIRGNLAAGGTGEVRPLSETDWLIARDIAPMIKSKGLIFVGLDIIGNQLTEINVTSPTCVREIEADLSISIVGMLMDVIEKYLILHKR